MDLALYARVLWRHQRILQVGLVLAVLLAVLSYYRVEMGGVVPKLTPRKAEVWQSSASVLLTQRRQVIPVPGRSDPGSLANVAGLYARLAMSDEVLRRIPKEARASGVFQASPSVDRSSDTVLPVVSLLGTGSTPGHAQAIVTGGLEAFLGYVQTEQGSAGVPKRGRVQLRVLNSPQPAVLLEPRKKTLPVVVFLSVLIAAISSAFILENRRRWSAVPEVDLKPAAPDEVELKPVVREEVELKPASREEVELRPAPHIGVDVGPRPEDEVEPEPASVRRWA